VPLLLPIKPRRGIPRSWIFSFTEEQVALQQAARRYAQERLPAIDVNSRPPLSRPRTELIHEYAEMGFLGINIPESLGGLGLGNLEALLVIEEFGKVSSAVAFPVFESCVGPVRAIQRFGQPALAQRVVPAVCRG
jgi:butyryl-CoA dehydrogenase